MRFNRQELASLASQPATKFDKEGILYLRERQDGFFRKNELNLERWCRLRGNLLFYFKSRDQWSEPLGVIVLELCTVIVDSASTPSPTDAHFGFFIVFDGGATQYLAAPTESDRSSWLEELQQASYDCLRLRVQLLQEQLEMRRGQDPHLDVHMWRLQRSHQLDPNEVPICEVSIFCDNLLCDGNGRPPNPMVSVHVFLPLENVWIKYAETELILKSSNPSYLNTVCFRASDGLTSDARVKLTVLDVQERVSMTHAPLGQAVITLATIQESHRLRIPLKCSRRTTIGFLSMVVWTVEREKVNSAESTPTRVPPSSQGGAGHRRCHSLPPRLSAKVLLPHQGALTQLFANPIVHTFRFHSGLGGDICVQETMAESRICFTFPQQLLAVWIQEEKELLQEVAGMGELRPPWHSRQIELLEKHLSCLKTYSQAKEHLQSIKNRFFKQSSRKQESSDEFTPTNLHLQRMWVQNDSLKRSGFYDVITVGAFAAHSPMHKTKNGGLIKLVQSLSEIPEGGQSHISTKTRMAFEAVSAIKQLRREVVDGMRTLMKLAREKKTQGMLPICEDMVKKSRTLLSVWDAGLVEEALTFVEENKLVQVVDVGLPLHWSDDTSLTYSMSPYRLITQKLNFDLKSPDVDDLGTPDSPNSSRKLWERPDYQNNMLAPSNGVGTAYKLTSHDYQLHREHLSVLSPPPNSQQRFTLPDENCMTNLCELDANHNGSIMTSRGRTSDDNDNLEPDSRMFLDTQAMCDSPSANYYKPTDEPEPWDLTQLNIEASVMCLVSKVKFLCGRCGSPAVRLRQRNAPTRCRGFLTNGNATKPNNTSSVVTSQPAGGVSSDVIHAVDSVSQAVSGAVNGPCRNKFTEGLDFDSVTDWACELRPSMRKLRQAMDGLLKTARLTHSAFRVQEDKRTASKVANVRYRRHVCFSQALTSLTTALMAKLWCQKPDPVFLSAVTSLGPLIVFEGLLSYHGDEIDMWGDMSVAVEDLATVKFTLTRHKSASEMPEPRVSGTRSGLTVCLPVPDAVLSMLPLEYAYTNESNAGAGCPVSFHVTPVFFNVGINERASLAEAMGTTKPQDKSNVDNFDRLNLYFHQFRKICPVAGSRGMEGGAVSELMDKLRAAVSHKQSKNVQILHLAASICRKLKGLRFTSCKSAKDRTGMSVTLEQANVLVTEYDLAEPELQAALDCMRSQGCRMENTAKNIGVKKYAINKLQVVSLPPLYRPPAGTYGSKAT